MSSVNDEWLVVQIKLTHPSGIGDDLWEELHFKLEDEEEIGVFLEAVDISLRSWIEKMKVEGRDE